jgi:hypothetical protein
MKLLKQGNNDCVLACIAMCLDLTLEQVHKHYPDYKGEGINMRQTMTILDRLGHHDYVQCVTNTLFSDRTYIITVPSLTVRGGNHAIVVHNHQVFDPNAIDKPDDSYNSNTLTSWSEVLEIVNPVG